MMCLMCGFCWTQAVNDCSSCTFLRKKILPWDYREERELRKERVVHSLSQVLSLISLNYITVDRFPLTWMQTIWDCLVLWIIGRVGCYRGRSLRWSCGSCSGYLKEKFKEQDQGQGHRSRTMCTLKGSPCERFNIKIFFSLMEIRFLIGYIYISLWLCLFRKVSFIPINPMIVLERIRKCRGAGRHILSHIC